MEIYLYSFITLALAHFMALLSPGVDFFLILSNSSKYGKVSGILTSTGIAFANLAYIVLALLGITLVKENQFIFTSIKFLGSIYLLYISIFLLKVKKRNLFSENEEKQNSKKECFKFFTMGFLSAILNPKNSIFYFTMFSISLQEHTPFIVQSIYGIWMFFAVLFWDIFIVYLVTNKKSRNYLEKYSNLIEKISGAILFIISISIIVNIF